jgi:hypothetical protein
MSSLVNTTGKTFTQHGHVHVALRSLDMAGGRASLSGQSSIHTTDKVFTSQYTHESTHFIDIHGLKTPSS